MTISATIVADSVSPRGKRIITMQLRYPKFIHGEFMTHRVFSRNASSSQAIPVKKLIEDMRRDPAMPVFWGSNKPGMQAGDELTGVDLDMCKTHWREGMKDAIKRAEKLMANGLHKQLANRILEPWCHINVVVTATEWENFFALRCHLDAQPEMRALAEAMRDAMAASTPRQLDYNSWHLPYVTDEDMHSPVSPVHLSVARCARVSYLTHDGKEPNIGDDAKLYERLVGSVPIHASPAEHQAIPDTWDRGDFEGYGARWSRESEHGNFVGWRQYRKMIEHQLTT